MNAKLHKSIINIDTDPEGRQFMLVSSPEHVSVEINALGEMTVNVNDSCIFRIANPNNVRVSNQMASVLR